jgi:hypothetical protein
MTQRTRAENRGNATEQKFYLPARASMPFVASRVERFWAALFDHRV